MEDGHLSSDEIEAALRYALNDGPADHLASCPGCQNSVAWYRQAKLGTLASEDSDWPLRTYVALAKIARQHDRGFLYAIPTHNQYSYLARMQFQHLIVKIRLPRRKDGR